ncbi:hypothetical protein [Streptomyces sp. NPDC001348]
MDERAAVPGEETELDAPEESEEAIRTLLWEAWTAGGPTEGTDRKRGSVASSALGRRGLSSE